MKLHRYCFTYYGYSINDNPSSTGSMYAGLPDQNITKAIIDANKSDAQMRSDSVLWSVIYLGFMTDEEFAPSPQSQSQDCNTCKFNDKESPECNNCGDEPENGEVNNWEKR